MSPDKTTANERNYVFCADTGVTINIFARADTSLKSEIVHCGVLETCYLMGKPSLTRGKTKDRLNI